MLASQRQQARAPPHDRPQRVLQRRHQHAGGNAVAAQRLRQIVHVQAGAWVGADSAPACHWPRWRRACRKTPGIPPPPPRRAGNRLQRQIQRSMAPQVISNHLAASENHDAARGGQSCWRRASWLGGRSVRPRRGEFMHGAAQVVVDAGNIQPGRVDKWRAKRRNRRIAQRLKQPQGQVAILTGAGWPAGEG